MSYPILTRGDVVSRARWHVGPDLAQTVVAIQACLIPAGDGRWIQCSLAIIIGGGLVCGVSVANVVASSRDLGLNKDHHGRGIRARAISTWNASYLHLIDPIADRIVDGVTEIEILRRGYRGPALIQPFDLVLGHDGCYVVRVSGNAKPIRRCIEGPEAQGARAPAWGAASV